MIEITVFIKDNDYIGVKTKGHADYADAGEDIVCAAVSVLTINTLNSIETFTDDDFTCEEEDGYLEYHLTEPVSEAAKLLMKSLVLGITDIWKNYGDTYIKIVNKEV